MSESAETAGRVRRCVADAIAEVNTLRPVGDQLASDPDAVLVGDEGPLDSLGLVNFAVALETRVEQEFGVAPGLVADILGAPDPSRFRTVALMESFVNERIAIAG